MSKPLVTAIVLLLLAPPVSLGVQQPDSPLIRVRSELVPIYATVLDRDGQVVTDLSATNFQVFDEGRVRELHSFLEIRDGRVLAPSARAGSEEREGDRSEVQGSVPEKRFLVLHFSSTLDPFVNSFGLYRAKRAARELVGRLDEQHDFVAVSWQYRLSEFTSNRERALSLIEEARPRSFAVERPVDPTSEGSSLEDLGLTGPDPVELRPVSRLTLDPLDSYEERLEEVADLMETGSFEGYSRTLARLNLLQGRKVLVFFGLGQENPDFGLGRGARRYDPIRVARAFNDAGFSVFALNPNGITASAFPGLPGPAAGVTTPGGRLALAARLSFAGREWVRNSYLNIWSEATGGFAFTTNDLSMWVQRALERSGSYYLLSFAVPPEGLDGKYHPLAVKVSNPNWRVLHRGGYYATVSAPHELEQRTLMTGLIFPERFNEFPLTLEAQLADSAELQVFLSFPFENIPLSTSSASGKARQRIRVFLVASDGSGRVLGSREDTFHLEIDLGELQDFRVRNAEIERSIRLTGLPRNLKAVVIVGENEQVSATAVNLGS